MHRRVASRLRGGHEKLPFRCVKTGLHQGLHQKITHRFVLPLIQELHAAWHPGAGDRHDVRRDRRMDASPALHPPRLRNGRLDGRLRGPLHRGCLHDFLQVEIRLAD